MLPAADGNGIAACVTHFRVRKIMQQKIIPQKLSFRLCKKINGCICSVLANKF